MKNKGDEKKTAEKEWKEPLSIYKKVIDITCSSLEILAAVMLAGMVLIIFYHVIMRYFFSAAPRWSEELSLQLMIWFCFIAMLLGVKDGAHISIELFVKKLPKKLLFAVELLDKVLILIFGGILGTSLRPYIIKLSRNKLPATGLPVWIQFVAPTVAGLLIVLIILEQIILQFKYGLPDNSEGPEIKEEEAGNL